MSFCLKLVVENVFHYTKICCLILQLNRAETVAKRQCFSCFGKKVFQKFYFYAFSKIQIMLSPQGCLFSLEIMKDFRLI